MKATLGATCAVLLLLVSGTSCKVHAQAADAFVLPTGQMRIGVGGEYSSFDSRYNAAGDEDPFGAEFGQPLTSTSFAPLAPLGTYLTSFLSATAGGPGFSSVAVDDETLTLGTPDVTVYEDELRVPFELALGVLPRVELGIRMARVRGSRLLERFLLTGGTLGVNPDPAANAAALATIGDEWASLGGFEFLPVDSSALGKELQRRVGALGGGILALPSEMADTSALQAALSSQFGVIPLRTGIQKWRMSDATVTARVLLVSSLDGAPLPTDSAHGLNFRSAVSVAARLPTGTKTDSAQLVPFAYEMGRTGFSVGWDNDVFMGDSFWATLGGRYSVLRPADVVRRLAPASLPFSTIEAPVTIRQDPGDVLELHFAPRYRMADAIAIGIDYSLTRVGATSYTAETGATETSASVLDLPSGTTQRLGIGIRYSSLPAHWMGTAMVPAEANLAYSRILSGAPGEPAASVISASISFLPHLWGHPSNRTATP